MGILSSPLIFNAKAGDVMFPETIRPLELPNPNGLI